MKGTQKLAPEVTADIVRRLRQAERQRRHLIARELTTVCEQVYEVDRDEVAAAYAAGLLEDPKLPEAFRTVGPLLVDKPETHMGAEGVVK